MEQGQKRIITDDKISHFIHYLTEDEKSRATIRKYIRDLKKLMQFARGREITKTLMMEYKEHLYSGGQYRITSINSFLVAANCFLTFYEWYDARVKTFRIQKEVFCPQNRSLDREDYRRLLQTAKEQKKTRLYMILQTIASTGMRVSEIRYVTVEAVKKGMVQILNKGKVRTILLPGALQKQLLLYARSENIHNGAIFLTRSGRPVERTGIWREMKKICRDAGVDEEKVFPHNLRHLFAQCFYHIKKDLSKLADLLGHSSIETTRLYIREPISTHRKQLELLGLVDTGWCAT